ncbi:MAG: serine acetyltransferase [Spirochaetes bacterium]|jgi:serine O-acetyltransferase|nr:serine acetyltransferase [Spirochaetota bacterium]
MNNENRYFIKELASTLATHEVLSSLYHQDVHSTPMPSVEKLKLIVSKLRAVLFPGYFGLASMRSGSVEFYIGSLVDELYELLSIQIQRGFCFICNERNEQCRVCDDKSADICREFLQKLPAIRHLLATDAMAGYEGDPASFSVGEIIFSYPSIKALTNYRIAHELIKLDVPLIPRIISELAHSETGIDIHPGAVIGESCFIDHGTGVVIGETCRIGKNVRIYQGVTLGAKSFPLDENGNPIKGIDRHPKVGNDVIIYAGATILGTVMIGDAAEIGGNVWITRDVPAGSKVRAQSFEK